MWADKYSNLKETTSFALWAPLPLPRSVRECLHSLGAGQAESCARPPSSLFGYLANVFCIQARKVQTRARRRRGETRRPAHQRRAGRWLSKPPTNGRLGSLERQLSFQQKIIIPCEDILSPLERSSLAAWLWASWKALIPAHYHIKCGKDVSFENVTFCLRSCRSQRSQTGSVSFFPVTDVVGEQ